MSNRQPKKKGNTYEDRLSLEMKNIIKEAKMGIKNEFPSLYLTEHLFFLTALDIEGSFLYEALATFLKEKDIMWLYDKLQEIIDKEILSVVKPGIEISYSDGFTQLLNDANAESKNLKCDSITSDHMLLAYLNRTDDNDEFLKILAKKKVTFEKVKKASISIDEKLEGNTSNIEEHFSNFLRGIIGGTNNNVISCTIGVDGMDGTFNPISAFSEQTEAQKKNDGSIDFCEELVSISKKTNNTFIGRDEIIDTIVNTMAKKNQSNVILVGENGVGKTTIIKSIAKRISNGEMPEFFAKKIYSINASEIMAGTQFRGVFETRVNSLINGLEKEKDAIAFIDNVQDIVTSDMRSDEASGLINGLLNNDNISIIMAITPKGYKSLSDRYKSAVKKMQKINVEPSSIEDTIKILQGLKGDYEKYHEVRYTNNFAEICTKLSFRYLNDKFLPSSAINLMDEIGATVRTNVLRGQKNEMMELKVLERKLKSRYSENNAEELKQEIEKKKDEIAQYSNKFKNIPITEDDIFNTISKMSNIPISKISLSEKTVLKNIDASVRNVVIGQNEAIEKICRIIKRSKIGLSPSNKPIGSFLCVGNTGCGKTLMAKTIAKEVFGDEKYLVRFDMSEYSDETAVNKLIGSSAGYVGYSEGGLLTEAVKNKKYAVVLIDEIEKANDKIFNLFLQVLDEGFLTDNMGEKVDFKNTIIIMTSNIGVKEASISKGIGFTVDNVQNRKTTIEKALKNKFAPEFLNRLNDIIYFNDLTDDNIKEIIGLELNKLIGRLKNIKYDGVYGVKTVDPIFERVRKEKEFGARPIARAIQDMIENKITDMLLEKDYENNYKFNFDEIVK